MPHIHILHASEEQLDDVAVMFDRYRVFYGRESDLNAARSFLVQRMTDQDSVVFIAYVDSQPAGFAQLYPSYSSVSLARTWILNDLFVNEDFRRKGVAQSLLDRSVQHAKESQSAFVSLVTGVENHSAQSLYESAHWLKDEEYIRYVYKM